jgi:hypothetical protein
MGFYFPLVSIPNKNPEKKMLRKYCVTQLSSTRLKVKNPVGNYGTMEVGLVSTSGFRPFNQAGTWR